MCSVRILEVGEGTELHGLGQLSDFDGIDYSLVWLTVCCESLGRAGVVNWYKAGSSRRLLFKMSKYIVCTLKLSTSLQKQAFFCVLAAGPRAAV